MMILKENSHIKVVAQPTIVGKYAKRRSRLRFLKNGNAVLEAARGRIPNSFRVPGKIYFGPSSNGYKGALLMEGLGGKPLEVNGKPHPRLSEYIPTLASYMANMREFNPGLLPKDFGVLDKSWFTTLCAVFPGMAWKKLHAERYARDVLVYDSKEKTLKLRDSSNLVNIVKSGTFSRRSFNHGDLHLHHIFVKGNDLSLIDFDSSTTMFPEHYDATDLIADMITQYGALKDAISFSQTYRSLLSASHRGYFDSEFMPLMAIHALSRTRRTSKDLEDALINGHAEPFKKALKKHKKTIAFSELVENGFTF